MERVINGHRRFLAEVFPVRKQEFHLLAESQAPEFLFVTCADSRIVPDMILGTGPGDLAIVVPLSRTHRVPTEVQIEPPEGGLEARSYALPYQVRAISRERLKRRRGEVSASTVRAVIANVHLLTRAPETGTEG